MKSILTRVPSTVLAVALLAAPVTAFAQAQPPTRVDNIWDWHDHQSTETQVQRKEKAAGIAPTPSQEASDAVTLRQIYRQLLHRIFRCANDCCPGCQELLRRAGCQPKSTLRVSSTLSVLATAAAGIGIALLPAPHADAHSSNCRSVPAGPRQGMPA